MKLLLVTLCLFALTACTPGSEPSTGGAVTGPTIVVNCQLQSAGGGQEGDVIVNTECPHDSNNPVTSGDTVTNPGG